MVNSYMDPNIIIELKKTQQLVKENILIKLDNYNLLSRFIKPSIDKLISEICSETIFDSKTNIVMIGEVSSGKTALLDNISKVLNGEIINTSRSSDNVGTQTCSWNHIGEFYGLDIPGEYYGDLTPYGENMKHLEEKLLERKPDIIVVVTNSDVEKANSSVGKNLSNGIKMIISKVRSVYNITLPVVFVYNKIDIHHIFGKSDDEDWSQYTANLDSTHYENIGIIRTNLKKYIQYFKENDTKYSSVPIVMINSATQKCPFRRYGITTLIDVLNQNIRNSILLEKSNEISSLIKTIGIRIISQFTVMATLSGTFPILIDSAITNYLQGYMVDILEVFSNSKSKTAYTFKQNNKLKYYGTSILRSICLAATVPLDLTGIGIPLSMAIGASVSGISFPVVGAAALNYFTDP